MMIAAAAIDAVRDIVDASDFYRESHGRICLAPDGPRPDWSRLQAVLEGRSVSEVALHLEDPNVIVRVMLTHDRAIDDFLADCRARGWPPSDDTPLPERLRTQHRVGRLLAEAWKAVDEAALEPVEEPD